MDIMYETFQDGSQNTQYVKKYHQPNKNACSMPLRTSTSYCYI